MMFLSIFAMVTGSIFALYSCNKDDDETLDPSYQEPQNGKLLAVTDNNTGRTTYHFDIEKMNMLLNEKLTSKTSSDRYVVESMEIVDTNPLNANQPAEIKMTILDTEEELSGTLWMMRDYTKKIVGEQTTSYYVDNKVTTGKYEFAYRDGDKLFVVHVNGSSYVITEENPMKESQLPRWILGCTSENCGRPCEKDGTFWNAFCKPCTYPENGKCISGIAEWVDVAVTVGVALIGALL